VIKVKNNDYIKCKKCIWFSWECWQHHRSRWTDKWSQR